MSFTYSAKQLIKVHAWFADHPQGTIKLPSNCWPNDVLSRDEWRRWFAGCLNEKINRDMPSRGRKDSLEYFSEMRRAADQINHPRLVIDWLPKDLQARFATRLRINLEQY